MKLSEQKSRHFKKQFLFTKGKRSDVLKKDSPLDFLSKLHFEKPFCCRWENFPHPVLGRQHGAAGSDGAHRQGPGVPWAAGGGRGARGTGHPPAAQLASAGSSSPAAAPRRAAGLSPAPLGGRARGGSGVRVLLSHPPPAAVCWCSRTRQLTKNRAAGKAQAAVCLRGFGLALAWAKVNPAQSPGARVFLPGQQQPDGSRMP